MKVCEKVPVERMPESQTSGPVAVSLVVVWVLWKFHVTVSPGKTSTTFGPKEFPTCPTSTVLSARSAAAASSERTQTGTRIRDTERSIQPGDPNRQAFTSF
jgi:hypothetical protein